MDATKKQHGNDSLEAITAQYYLAGTFRNNEQLRKAEKILLRCLKTCYAQHFETSSNKGRQEVVALILLFLGEICIDWHEIDKAKELFNRSLVLAKKAFGNGHLIVSTLRYRLVIVSGLEKLDGSEIDSLKKELKSCKVDDDDAIISINHHLCISYLNHQILDLAMEAGLKSLTRARKTSQMRSVGDALHCLSIIQSKQGEWDQALSYIEEAIPILRAEYGEKNVSVAQALYQLGEIYVHQGKDDDALKLYKKALRYTRRCVGDKYYNLPTCTYSILNIYDRKGQPAEALRILEKDEEFFRSILPDYEEIATDLRT
jgi:tetratricopeptide (TPR) repeat protein